MAVAGDLSQNINILETFDDNKLSSLYFIE